MNLKNKLCSYFVIIVYHGFHLHDILIKLGHSLLLKRKVSYDPATRPSNVSIYFVENFLKSHNFRETRGSTAISCQASREDKIVLKFLLLHCRQN